jgi:ferric-dicitrate binding protein FerR (iron transport regulator)
MNKLDQAINQIINEEVPQDRMDEAASRVRRNLFAHASGAPDRLRSCADFQALIPAYLGKSLSAGRALLLQDHTRECVACRHALDQARAGKVRTLVRPQTPPSRSIPKAWAIAAMAVLTLGVGTLAVTMLWPGTSASAKVQTVSGILYAVSDAGSTPIFAGKDVPEGQKIRTAKGSKAYVKLGDGSLIEMNERSEIAFHKGMRGVNINLDRGDIIVQAAKQRNGTLNVLTRDCTVSVKGTIFAVNSGVKGSRVTVVEGAVKVDQGSQSQLLKPGQQVSTDASLAQSSPTQAVSWSRDASRYLALLGEFSVIQKGLEQMAGPGLRNDSKLLAYVPDNTILYASIPNMGPALAEADRLFKQRLNESAVLKQWWDEQKDGPKIDEMVQKLRTFSDYLGDEIVLSVAGNWNGEYSAPLILAEVKKPGLDGFLQNEFSQIAMRNGNAAHMPKVVNLDEVQSANNGDHPRPLKIRRGQVRSGDSMAIGLRNNLLAIGWAPEQLQDVQTRIAQAQQPRYGGMMAQVKSAYGRGVAYLLAVNMEHIAENSVKKGGDRPETGFESMRYLIVERKDIGGRTENQATLAFAGRRSGMAGWLSSPAPMGSLEFVSPNATFAVSMALKSPQGMISDLLNTMGKGDPQFEDKLEGIRQQTGMRISPSLGEPLGGDITFAVDGPLLPLPSWKLAVEVYSPDRLQFGIQQMIDAVNKQPKCPECKIDVTKEDVGGRTFYTLSTQKISYEIHYTYVDGFLLAAPSQSLLTKAIQNRQTGQMLSRSEAFRAQLPRDGNLNFSALIYHNVGSALAPFAEQIGSVGTTEEQKASIRNLVANSKPGLIYAYGDDDAIRVATGGTFFGLNLENFALPTLLSKGLQGPSAKGAMKQ